MIIPGTPLLRPPLRALPCRLQLDGAANDPGGTSDDFDLRRQMLDFVTDGSEYEIDQDAIAGFRQDWEEANRRWALERSVGKPSGKIGGVLDDPGSKLRKWYYDPVVGPEPSARFMEKMLTIKGRTNLITRPAMVLAACMLGLRAPTNVGRASSALGVAVHLGVPCAWLLLARTATLLSSLQRAALGNAAQTRTTTALPLASAPVALAAQHLFGATTVFAISALLWAGGAWFTALIVACIGRVSLLPGLWHWADLNMELMRGSQNVLNKRAFQATRIWRLAASAFCLAEACTLLRFVLSLGTIDPLSTTVQAHLLSQHAAICQFFPWMPTSGASLLLRVPGSVVSDLLRPWLNLFGQTSFALMVAYMAYWLAYPVEALTRNWWRATLKPSKSSSVRTLSSGLLVLLRIARPSLKLSELLRAQRELNDPTGRERVEQIKVDEEAEAAAARAFDEERGWLSFGRGRRRAKRSAREDEDMRRVVWALGEEDLAEASGDSFLTQAKIVSGGSDGASGTDGSWSAALNEGSAPVSGVSVPKSWGSDEAWAFMELGRLLVQEDDAIARMKKKRAEAGLEDDTSPPWDASIGESTVSSIFLNRVPKKAKAVDGTERERSQKEREDLAELLRMKFSLENWAQDPPPGYRMPKLTAYPEGIDPDAPLKSEQALTASDGNTKRELKLSKGAEQRLEAEGMTASVGEEFELSGAAESESARLVEEPEEPDQ